MARQITKTEMLQLYEKGLTSNEINTGTRIYARSVKGQGDNPLGYEVVWCNV